MKIEQLKFNWFDRRYIVYKPERYRRALRQQQWFGYLVMTAVAMAVGADLGTRLYHYFNP